MASKKLAESSLKNMISRYNQCRINRLSLGRYANFGRESDQTKALKESCTFLHREAPVRLAHMISEIESLPPRMLEQPELHKVYQWYQKSFVELLEYKKPTPEQSEEDKLKYCAGLNSLIDKILIRHEPVVITMARGIRRLTVDGTLERGMQPAVREFLDRFYMSRIGIRFLFNQHLTMFTQGGGVMFPNNASNRGSIDSQCCVSDIVFDAGEMAKYLCEQKYGVSPNFRIITPQNRPSDPVCFTYVPSHLHYILFELLKNSFRAVVENHEEDKLPDVKVIVVKGEEDVTIKVSDEGNGIPHRNTEDLFTYFYTTAEDLHDEMDSPMEAPMAGLGFGLPLSRLYARYFGGDLNVVSIDGFGTDAYVYLHSVPENAVECLPSYAKEELSYNDQFEKDCNSSGNGHWLEH